MSSWLYICSKSVASVWYRFSQYPGFTGPAIKGHKWEWPLIIAPSYFLLPSCDLTLSLCSGLSLQGEVLPLGDTTMIPLTWKLRLPPSLLGLLVPLNWQAKRRVDVLSISRVTDTDYQGKIGVLLDKQKGGRAFLGYRRSPQKSLSTTMPCDRSQWKSTAIKRRQDC